MTVTLFYPMTHDASTASPPRCFINFHRRDPGGARDGPPPTPSITADDEPVFEAA